MNDKRYRWDAIYDRIKNHPAPIGAEIGVHRGENSGQLLKLHPGLTLYMIDMWSQHTYDGKGDDAATEPYRKLYTDHHELNLEAAKLAIIQYEERVRLLRMESLEAARRIDVMFDFIFIDASHSYHDVIDDITAWSMKIKKGGWIFGHDYGNPNFEGTTEAVNDMFVGMPIETDDDYFWGVRL